VRAENRNRKSRRRSLSHKHARQLARLIADEGVRAVAASLGVHPQTASTLACGAEGNLSTVTLIERQLDRRDETGSQ
jgi:hypothetical protein